MRHVIILLLAMMCLAGCKEKKAQFTYTNPNSQVLMRDTQIIPHEEDGKFYAIGTVYWGGGDENGESGYRLYISENMKDWELGPWIMKQSEIAEDEWPSHLFWAPELHKINGKWYFTYNCHGKHQVDRDRYAGEHASGISVADKITGPYTMLAKKPIAPWPTNDLSLFQDDNGKVYAYFNDGFFNMENYPESKHSIYVAELDLEKGELIEEPHKLLTQQDGFENTLIEGAYAIKVDGIYYLFYSGTNDGYAVGYATATDVHGPYTRASNIPLFGARSDGALLKDGKVITDLDHPYIEIGHNQIFKGPDGRYWTSCHAYVKSEHYDQFGSKLLYDPIEFKDGKVITNAPTWTPQTVDIDPQMLKKFPGLADSK